MIIVDMLVILALALLIFLPNKKYEQSKINFTGALVFGLSVIIMSHIVGLSDSVEHIIYEILRDWQGLIGAAATIGAGYWAYRAALLAQIERKREEAAAAKATLALLLADTLDELEELYVKIDADIKFKQECVSIDQYKSNVIIMNLEKYQNCVKYLDDHIAENITTILVRFQILRSRVNAFYKDDRNNSTDYSVDFMRDNLLYILDLTARVQSIFDYARKGSDFRNLLPSSELEKVFNNIRFLRPDGAELEDISDLIARMPSAQNFDTETN